VVKLLQVLLPPQPLFLFAVATDLQIREGRAKAREIGPVQLIKCLPALVSPRATRTKHIKRGVFGKPSIAFLTVLTAVPTLPTGVDLAAISVIASAHLRNLDHHKLSF
jgi:hypothetical protein